MNYSWQYSPSAADVSRRPIAIIYGPYRRQIATAQDGVLAQIIVDALNKPVKS